MSQHLPGNVGLSFQVLWNKMSKLIEVLAYLNKRSVYKDSNIVPMTYG